MKLYRCLVEFKGFNVGDVIMDASHVHSCLVKLGDPKNKTVYRHDLPSHLFGGKKTWDSLVMLDIVRELSRDEIIKISHHMTWRIWIMVGSGLNNTGQMGFSFDVVNEKKSINGTKPRLLPIHMCIDCMFEGNKYLTKPPKFVRNGKCRCCGRERGLSLTVYAYPLNLEHKGFGSTIGPFNMPSNEAYYKKHFLIEDWD